jgi:hypothetical protein
VRFAHLAGRPLRWPYGAAAHAAIPQLQSVMSLAVAVSERSERP